jgi:hypothetical protein
MRWEKGEEDTTTTMIIVLLEPYDQVPILCEWSRGKMWIAEIPKTPARESIRESIYGWVVDSRARRWMVVG